MCGLWSHLSKGGHGTQVPQGTRDLDLRSVWLLDNQSTFNLCCNPDISGKRHNAKQAMNMLSNGGGLQISKECMVPGYDFWVWFTIRVMTNISFVSRNWFDYIRWGMIASVGRHLLYIGRNLVSRTWSLIWIHVVCMSTTPRSLMGYMVFLKLLQRTWSCSPSNR